MRGSRGGRPGGLAMLALLLGMALTACVDEGEDPVPMRVVGGDPGEGRRLIAAYECGVCHVIPGIRGARGRVGPSLEAFVQRAYIAGVLPNRPGGLTRWLQDPPGIAPETAMPALGLTDTEARHMAAYLYTLR